jgi:3-hydroxyisobutyrate dehydrogenase-like beta-hydroxyacid dehydrogenase
MTSDPLGFIGLGNMGGPMAANLAAAGHALVCFDAADTKGLMPEGAIAAGSAAEVAAAASTIFMCLPDGAIVLKVAAEIVAAPGRRVTTIVDNTTAGVSDAKAAHKLFTDVGITYADAPVSGGVSGATAGTLSMMISAPDDLFEKIEPLVRVMAKNARHVGTEPGHGMAMKLLNNFLSGMAMAASSEGVAYGVRQGLDPNTIIDVLNLSSGRNSCTADKFPNRILPGTYDSGFATKLMAKDLTLYVESASAQGSPTFLSKTLLDGVWSRMVADWPDSDFTEIYPYLKEHGS